MTDNVQFGKRRTNRSLRLSMSLAGAAAFALIGCSDQQADSGCSQPHGALVPAYLPPAGLRQLVAQPDPTRLVVINPDNGPGSALDPEYADVIDQLRDAGTRVLGYVATGYATRDPEVVRREVARYASWYKIDDLFVDEVSSDEASLPYYTALSATLRRTNRLLAFNPGMVPAGGYFGLADIVVTFEGSFAEYRAAQTPAPAPVNGVPRTRTAHLVFGATDDQAIEVAAGKRADYVYATSGTFPNPWSTLASSFTDQQSRLAAC